jgi:hypothetical protein
MSPVEFLARIAALVPPPHYPLVRFAGALAPRSKWRPLVVPRPPGSANAPPACASRREPRPALRAAKAAPAPPPPRLAPGNPPRPAVFAHALAAKSDAVEVVAPNVLSLAHWTRLRDGELYAQKPRIDWPTLMKRTFDVDVKTCPKCAGRLEVRAVVTDPATTAKILASLARAPPRAA